MPTCYDTSGNFTPCPTGGASPSSFTDTLQQNIQGPGIGAAPGQCPMAPDGTCTDSYGNPGQSCLLIRECDPYDGAQHVQYQTPGGTAPNALIATVNPDGSVTMTDAKGNPTNNPGYAPPYLDHGVFTSQFNPTQQAKLSSIPNVGMQYDPSAGWVPVANSAPVETSPSVTAFQSPTSKPASPGVSNTPNQNSVPTNTNPSTNKYAAVGQPGAPGTSGVKTPVTTKANNHGWLLLAAGLAIILLSRA